MENCMEYAIEDDYVKILGRTIKKNNILYFNYSGSCVEFQFYGKDARAILWSDGGDEISEAWMAVYLNDDKQPSRRFCLEQGEKEYLLYQGDIAEKVAIRLVKMSEAAFAKAGIKAILTDGIDHIEPVKQKNLKMEFIGDSITCGYGNEGIFGKDVFCTSQENPCDAYAIQTAQMLNADYQLISWSGIGIISQWVDETVNEPLQDVLMPDLYQYTDKYLSRMRGWYPVEKWDTDKFKADIIIINMGTNDNSYTRDIQSRVDYFGKEYFKFIGQVRNCNPQAKIVCTLGTMIQGLCGEIQKQVRKFKAHYKDYEIYYMAFDEQNVEDGLGTDEHPSKLTHQKMANKLAEFIQTDLL